MGESAVQLGVTLATSDPVVGDANINDQITRSRRIREVVITEYSMNRRNEMIVQGKVVSGDGSEIQEVKIGVTNVHNGHPNLRGIIKTNSPKVNTLERLEEGCRERSGSASIMELSLLEGRSAMTKIMDKVTRANKILRKEQAGLAFTAVTGCDYAQRICNETEAVFGVSFMASAPKHYADARKRDDFQKWKIRLNAWRSRTVFTVLTMGHS